MSKALIISDGKKGHLNQSIAFCSYVDKNYDIVEVRFKNRLFKLVSYVFDFFGIYTTALFKNLKFDKDLYGLVVSAGSGTYYASKVIAKQFKIKSISMMLPRGLRYDFDVIFAQSHDNPPKASNIIEIPANFAFIKPIGLYKPNKQSVGIVIGGNNSYLEMDKDKLKEQLEFIKEHFKDYEIAVTTSPRTPREIEDLIISYKFDYEVIYSKNPINPIPDFVSYCDIVFITSDSTSMISESISFGEANIVILPLVSKKENKFNRFIYRLEKEGYLHIFNGQITKKNRKIDFRKFTKGIKI